MRRLIRRPRESVYHWHTLRIEPTGSNDSGPCECCGNLSRTVWGYIHAPDGMVAAYFVQWTLNNPEHGANFDLIVGKWGEPSAPTDRKAVAVAFRVYEGNPSFMVIDAETRPVADPELAGTALRREQVIGTPLAQNIFAMLDAIYAKDERLDEIRSWSGMD